MQHRGPDDHGTYVDGETLALGATRLSIIDLEGGHQPLANEDQTVWACLNGELYNHPALQEWLSSRGHRLATRTDTEVLVHLYEEFGDSLVHAIEGMFAFAVWDTRTRRLLVGRDRFGEKPLFYAADADRIAFASELLALRPGLRDDHDIDPAAADEFLLFGYVPGPGTMLTGVQQLPPGHLLHWSPGSAPTIECYWRPPEPAQAPRLRFEEVVDEVEDALVKSVRSRLIADVPVGVMLSGGIDSTLIAALATEISSTGVETFTVGYDVGNVSETGPAQQVADALGTTHHTLTIESRSMLDGVPALLRAMDQPLADHALIAIHAVAGFARERVKVAIGGEGADELFAGYPRYVWLSRADRLGTRLPDAVLRSLAGVARHGAGSRAARLSQILAPQSGIARHADWVTAGRLQTRRSVYGPRLLDQIAPGDSLTRLSALAASISAESTIGHFMQLDQRHWLPDDVLVKADRASMLVSLELRTPYLHPRLAELAATLPPEDHSGSGGKKVLRAVLDRRASRSIVRRPKAAFAVPVREWLRGPLLPFVDETIADGLAFEDGWLERDAVRVLRDRHAAGDDRHNLLWPVICFAAWLDGWHGHG